MEALHAACVSCMCSWHRPVSTALQQAGPRHLVGRESGNRAHKSSLPAHGLHSCGGQGSSHSAAHPLLQLELEDVGNEFNLMLQELTEWKHAYRTCLVPKQVSCLPAHTLR